MEIKRFENLSELYDAMMDGQDERVNDAFDQWSSDLPVFADKRPEGLPEWAGIWSYDEEWAIVGTCRSDLEIVNIVEYFGHEN